VAEGGKEIMKMVRSQSPEWAEEIKRRMWILLNGDRRAA
jgi:hypothetical protein